MPSSSRRWCTRDEWWLWQILAWALLVSWLVAWRLRGVLFIAGLILIVPAMIVLLVPLGIVWVLEGGPIWSSSTSSKA